MNKKKILLTVHDVPLILAQMSTEMRLLRPGNNIYTE